MSEPDLFETPDDGSLRPAPACDRPLIWIERLRLLASPDTTRPIREVNLRRGLNIILAPAGDGMGGHAAGKTTLCRLIRAALGEPAFGTDEAEQRIRSKFADGGVAAEVYVGVHRWAVWVPFSSGAKRKAARDVSVDTLPNGVLTVHGFEEYEAALQEATVKRLEVRSLARVSRGLSWRDILGWLARDQECRFRGLVTWREAESDSEGFRSAVEDRHELMRAVLNLISTTEHDELAKSHNLVRSRSENRGEAAQQESTAKRLSERFVRSHGLVPDKQGRMLRLQLDAVRQNIQRTLAQHKHDFADSLAPLDTKLLDEAYELAGRQFAEASNRIQDVSRSLNARIRHRKSLGGTQDDALNRLVEENGEPSPFCGQLLKVGAKAGCPLAEASLANGNIIDFYRARQELTEDEIRTRLDEDISTLKAQLESLGVERDTADERQKTIRLELGTIRTDRENTRSIYDRKKEQLDGKLKRIEDLEAEWAELDTIERKNVDIERDVATSRDFQTRHQNQQRQHVARISQAFDRLIKDVLRGDDPVSGECSLAGREIILKATGRNDLTSAAIVTVKVVLFDIACLVDSANGHGFHPRFLLHDSPREADLALSLYHRIFEAVRILEAAYPPEQAAFQYIITTTEPPPQDMMKSPWMVINPPLAASPKTERLFRDDL